MMDSPPTSAPSTLAATHPNMQLWDYMYESKNDIWTSLEGDQELMKFLDILTDGRSSLDVLVPMCGKTHAMILLSDKGHRVVGIEWSKPAVECFFNENNLTYNKRLVTIGEIEVMMYSANDRYITIYCGDFFAFKHDNLGGFDCIFDHGAIGCFDFTEIKRTTYAEMINLFTRPGGRVLLSTFDYEHSERPIVPFAVTEDEIRAIYKDYFKSPRLLAEMDAAKAADTFNLRVQGPIQFQVWTLSRFSWKLFLLEKQSL